MEINVGVIGAAGRMGTEVCRAVDADASLRLVAAIDSKQSGKSVSEHAEIETPVIFSDDIQQLVTTECAVVIDFTHFDVAKEHAEFCAEQGIHMVIGTSGFSEDDFAKLREIFVSSNCVVAANFAISAVLLMRFAELSAQFFETAEIIEFHHDGKIDAPSGTAIATAEAMAAANQEWAADPTTSENIAGSRGAKGAGGIPIHAVRMRGMTAHQEVVLGTTGQSLTLRQDSYDRSSFMPGVVLAAKKIGDYPGLTIGLREMLDI